MSQTARKRNAPARRKSPARKTAKKKITAKKQRRGRPFKPGVSGNPKGRPPAKYSLTHILKEAGRELQRLRINRKNVEASKAQLLALKLWAIALRGDVKAMALVFERIEGAPQQRVEIEHAYAKLAELEKMIARLEGGK